jgi:hypothetical protein
MCVVVSILCDGVFIIKKPGKSLSIIIECTTFHIQSGELLTIVVLRMIVDGPKQGKNFANIFMRKIYDRSVIFSGCSGFLNQ